jgi:hypothetical protein
VDFRDSDDTSDAGSDHLMRSAGRRTASIASGLLRRDSVVLIVLLAVVLVVSWPLGRKLFSEFSDYGDPPVSAWGLWWFKEQLFSLHDPWTASDIFAPQGTMIAFSAYVPLAGLILSPLTALLGPAITLNLTKLFLPLLLSYVVFRLALRLEQPRLVALCSGVLYGCSAQLVSRADAHFNFAAGALVPPLALLFVVRFRQERRFMDAALAGAVIGGGMLLDPTGVLFAVIACGTYVLGVAFRHRDLRRRLATGTAIAAVAAIVCASPQLLAMKRQLDAGLYTTDTVTLAGSWVLYGQSVESLFAPSPYFRIVHPVQELAARSGEFFPVYGWGLLFLAAAGAVAGWRRLLVRWMALLWLGATVMSLGPTLKIGDSTFAPAAVDRFGYRLSGILPYTWYVQIPGFADQRVAARFIILGLLPAALLAGFGSRALATGGLARRSLLAAALVVCALDLGSPMAFEGDVTQPEIYDAIRADRTDSIVVDVPLIWLTGTRYLGTPINSGAMLRATEHGHPIAYGVVGRANVQLLTALARNRFYTDLMVLQGGASLAAVPVPSRPDPGLGARNARALGVGWVVVQPTASPAVGAYLRSAGFRLHHQHDGVKVFRIMT